MADEEALPQEKPPRKKKLVTAAVLLGVMVAEGALIFGAMKMFGAAPASSAASEGSPDSESGESDATDPEDPALEDGSIGDGLTEVLITETDAFNNRSGRLYMYHIEVTALVKGDQAKRLQTLVEQRDATMRDRINTVIRGADPNQLNEPGLDTLRRQIQFELNKIIGNKELIAELLIPKLLQSRTSL